jgi:hypothetical protein
MKIEYAKVGGKENYEVLTKMQLEQVKQVVAYAKANPDAMKGQQKQPEEAQKPNVPLTKDQIASLKA